MPDFIKRLAVLLAAAALLLAGCTQRQPLPPSHVEESSSRPGQEQSAPAEEPDTGYDLSGLTLAPPAAGDSSPLLQDVEYMQKIVRLAFWQPKEQVYQVAALPMPQQGVSSLAVIQAVAGVLGVSLDVNAIARHKQMLVVDLPAATVNGPLADAEQEAVILNSIGMSLGINGNDVGFTMDGGQYRSANLTLENDGYGRYQPPDLKLAVKAGEYDAIRASIPYPGPKTGQLEYPGYVVELDATGKALADYLVTVGLPGEDFDDPAQIDPLHVLEQAIELCYLIQYDNINPEYQPEFVYQPQLFPIVVAVRDSVMILGEHVEQSARLIFGDAVTLRHQNVFKYTWHEAEGVYTPPHMGGGGPLVPIILGYEDKGDRYEAEVVYMQYGLDCFYVDGEPATGQKLLDYVKNRAPRHRAVVLKKGDGLLIQSIHKH